MYDLKHVITIPKEEFNFIVMGEVMDTPHGRLIYKDNGGSVLAVAHLDFVRHQQVRWLDLENGDKIYFSPALDDRLGAWAILTLAEKYKFDLLFTDGEELGMSTARHFRPEKEYNWIFSFDRAGFDCVMYDYYTRELHTLLDQYNFEVGNGSFSDISFMEHLGIKAFNFGVGYIEQHTEYCHAVLSNVTRQMEKFCVFYEAMKDTRLLHLGMKRQFAGTRPEDYEENVYLYHLGYMVNMADLNEEDKETLFEREEEYFSGDYDN